MNKKWKDARIKRFMDQPDPEEALRQWLREIGSKGGNRSKELGHLDKIGFKPGDPRAIEAGRKGGKISRRQK